MKAHELVAQMQADCGSVRIAGASFPALARRRGGWRRSGASLDILAADASAGHAAGYDDAVIDETGTADRSADRALGQRVAQFHVGAQRAGYTSERYMASGPFVDELLEAADDPAVCVHHHAPSGGCRHAGPGRLASRLILDSAAIKSVSYMTDTARLAAANPNLTRLTFRSHDMNLPRRTIAGNDRALRSSGNDALLPIEFHHGKVSLSSD